MPILPQSVFDEAYDHSDCDDGRHDAYDQRYVILYATRGTAGAVSTSAIYLDHNVFICRPHFVLQRLAHILVPSVCI